jgi:hypothetical protein
VKTRTVAITAAAGFALLGGSLWWWSGGRAKRSDAIFQKLSAPGATGVRGLEKDLEALYREDPSLAAEDWEAHPDYRGSVAAAAAPVPGCRALVEKALRDLGPPQRFYVTLCLATDGNPTIQNGVWTGTDPLRAPAEWRAFLEARLDAETVPEVLVLTAESLRGAGWKAGKDLAFSRARDASRPMAARGAWLVVLAGEPDGPRALMEAIEKEEIEDEAIAHLLESGVLRPEKNYRAWIEAVILGGKHPVAAGGAFVTLCQWPSAYRAWWIAAWDSDASRDPAARAAILSGGLGTLAAWASNEENPTLKLSLQTIYDSLKKP